MGYMSFGVYFDGIRHISSSHIRILFCLSCTSIYFRAHIKDLSMFFGRLSLNINSRKKHRLIKVSAFPKNFSLRFEKVSVTVLVKPVNKKFLMLTPIVYEIV
jgi:hypothetical protein